MKQSGAGRLVGLGEADGLGLAEDELAVGLGDAEPDWLEARGPAVRTGSSPRENSHQPPTRRTATTTAASRTQKPVSGVGAPVPGWV